MTYEYVKNLISVKIKIIHQRWKILSLLKLSYPITIDNKVLADFMLNTKPDTQRTKSENVIGNWVAEMEKKVGSHESEVIKLQQLNGLINSKPKRSGTNYFAGNACKICKSSYSFTIREKSLNQAPFIVNIQVIRTHEHQGRGEERVQHKCKYERT